MPDTSASDEQAYIDAILGPDRQQLDYLRGQQMQTDQQRLAGIKSLTDEFMHYLSGVPGQVEHDYSQAITQQMNMGHEAQQALAAASTNPQVQQDLQAIGAPQAQQTQDASQLGATFNGGGAVLLGTGGQIPAQQLSSDQAAQMAFARSLPAVAASTGQQTLRNYLSGSQQVYNDLNQQYEQLLSKVPQLRLDYRSSQADAAAKQEQLDLEYKSLGLRRQGQAFNQAATRTRLSQTQARLNQSADQQSLSNSYRFAEVYGYNPRTGQPTLAAIRAANADKRRAKKPPTATQISSWNKFAEDAYYAVPPKQRWDAKAGKYVSVPRTGKKALLYYPALKGLLARGATLARAQKILNALYAKGEGGRPYVSLQGRIALEHAGMPLPHTNAVPTAQQVDWLRAHGLWSD